MTTNLESNIILNTHLPLPKGKGFQSLHSQLQKIEKKLENLTKRDWKIKVTLDDSGLSSANLKIIQKTRQAAKEAKAAGKELKDVMNQIGKESQAAMQGQGNAGLQTGLRTVRTPTKKGIKTVITSTQEDAAGGIQSSVKTTRDSSGKIKKIEENLTDLAAKEEIKKRKENEAYISRLKKNSAKLEQQQSIEQFNQGLQAAKRDTEARKAWSEKLRKNSLALAQKLDDKDFSARENERQTREDWLNRLRNNSLNAAQKLDDKDFSAREKEQEKKNVWLEGVKRKSAAMEQSENVKKQQWTDRLKENSAVLEQKENQKKIDWYKKLRENSDALAQKIDDKEFNDRTKQSAGQAKWYGGMRMRSAVAATKIGDQEFNERESQQERQNRWYNRMRRRSLSLAQRDDDRDFQERGHIGNITNATAALHAEGFQRRGSSYAYNKRTGAVEETMKFQRVTGNPFRGYQVEIAHANLSTGKFTRTMLEGAAASRALGDSMFHAIAKVAMWSVATGTVFAGIQIFRSATEAIIELEQSTVLLARVGRGMSGDFKERLVAAERLSRGIIGLTATIGGNSEEAVKAAAVFARAGQSEKQILESVRASLLASRIAELDVVEAAELMSSAIYQFGGDVTQMIPTLDMLNTLSNQYRVTTDDLLQSVSRSGSIIAQQNGRMSELAATTAVTASVTSRSGAEIGNAMKTIASQVDRVETKRYLLEKLGITVHDVGGSSKSYTRFLLDMSLALETATDSERNLATTQVAGVRQRNVLLAQMKNVVEIIKAENKALLGTKEDDKYGSAATEFQQTSDTMEATLQRLRAQALLTSSELGGGFVKVGKDIANIVTGMLKLISVGNEMTGGMLSSIAVVGALTAAMQALAHSYGVTPASIMSFVRSLIESVDTTDEVAASNRRLIMSTLGTTAAFAAASAAILVALDILSQFAKQMQLASEIQQSQQQSMDREITKQQNRATAYRRTTEAIIAMRMAVASLRDEESKTGKDRSKSIGKIEGGIKSISEQVGIGYDPRESIDQTIAKGMQKEQEAADEEAKIVAQKIAAAQAATNERNNAIAIEQAVYDQGQIVRSRLAQNTSGDLLSAAKGPGTTMFERRLMGRDMNHGGVGTASPIKFAGMALAPDSYAVSEIQAAQAALLKLKKEAATAAEEIEKLKSRLEQLKKIKAFSENREEIERSVKLLVSFSRIAEESQQKRIADNDASGLFGTGSEVSRLKKQYDDIKKEVSGVYDAYVKLREAQILDAEQAQDAEKRLLSVFDEERKLLLQIQQIRTQSIRSENQTINADASKIRQGTVRIALQRQRGLSTGNSSFGEGVVDIEIQRRSIIEDNIALFREADEIRSKSADSEQKSLALESIKQKIAENLVQLRSLEADKTLSIYEAEKNIAIERKKSADEALRALGALSREDKARVMAQAMFFNKNPNKVITAEQQFLMGAEDNRIGRQFFGGRFEDLSESNSGMARFLNSAGFGMTQDIRNGQRELTRFRNGRTNQQLEEEARRNGLAIGQQQARLSGDQGQMDANQFRAGMQGALANVVAPQLKDIHIQHRFDFSGVSEQLQRIYQFEAAQAANQVAQELKTYVDKRLALSKLPPPKVAAPQ